MKDMAEGWSGEETLITRYLEELREAFQGFGQGDVATYIPELAKADPDDFGLAIATVDGRVYVAGQSDRMFTIQSVSKPFMYGLALETHGREAVLAKVGVEPTGEAFNSTVLDHQNNRPCNPMVNAGAIAVSALVAGDSYGRRHRAMLDLFGRYAGREMTIDDRVFQSERETGDRNRAIAALMQQTHMMEGEVDEILDLYFSQCSVVVSCRDLAQMAAGLANGGVNPRTGTRVIPHEYVHDVLTVMNSCGMYNYAGQWSYEVGIPAKSGVSGAIAAVIPGQVGIAAYSPRLDRFGNSVRGVAALKRIAEDFALHVFRTPPSGASVIRRVIKGDVIGSKRARNAEERACLDALGGRIQVIEAQGALFFGSAERLVRQAAEAAAEADHVILDLRRVFSADQAACALLMRLAEDLAGAPGRLLIAHLPAGGDLEALRRHAATTGRTVFEDRDAALEWCENQLLAGQMAPRPARELAIGECDLFRGLGAAELAVVGDLSRRVTYAPGDFILREGEAADRILVVLAGLTSVQLALPGGPRRLRIATIGPGGVVGEMALFDGGLRSADVLADDRVVCREIATADFHGLLRTRPDMLQAIYANLTRDLAARLRTANREIRVLEQ